MVQIQTQRVQAWNLRVHEDTLSWLQGTHFRWVLCESQRISWGDHHLRLLYNNVCYWGIVASASWMGTQEKFRICFCQGRWSQISKQKLPGFESTEKDKLNYEFSQTWISAWAGYFRPSEGGIGEQCKDILQSQVPSLCQAPNTYVKERSRCKC